VALFEYQVPGAAWALARVTSSLTALGVWLIAGFIALVWSVRVMPVD